MAKKPTRFGKFLLVFDEWTTVKFEHCQVHTGSYKRQTLCGFAAQRIKLFIINKFYDIFIMF